MQSKELPAKFHCNMAPNTVVVKFNIFVSNDNFYKDEW